MTQQTKYSVSSLSSIVCQAADTATLQLLDAGIPGLRHGAVNKPQQDAEQEESGQFYRCWRENAC